MSEYEDGLKLLEEKYCKWNNNTGVYNERF